MKIAMIIDARDPILGGWQIHVKNICEKLIKNHNCDVDLFVRALESDDWVLFYKDEILLNGRLRVFRCWRPKKFFHLWERILSIFSIFFRVIHENKIKKYDIIHAHTFLWLLSWKLSSFILKVLIIWTVHGANLLDTWKKWLYYYVEKTLLTCIKYDTLISVWSSFLKYENRNKNIKVIWNGINIEDFESIESVKNNNIFKILFVWRLEWTKWIDILIDAINQLDKKLLEEKKVEFHLVWYWYQEEEYKEIIKKYNLEKYVFFRWKITWSDLIQEYKSSDLFILPSRTEGFWITLLEAMISKVPVIATRCGWPEDIIENWKNGFLVDKENSEELKNIISEFLTWKVTNLDIIKQNWYNTVINNFTWDIITEKIFNEYKKFQN